MTETAVGNLLHKIHALWEYKLYKNILHIQPNEVLVDMFSVM